MVQGALGAAGIRRVSAEAGLQRAAYRVKGQGHQAALAGCSSNYIIYVDDTMTFSATAQSESLPVDHEYSWCKVCWVPQA